MNSCINSKPFVNSNLFENQIFAGMKSLADKQIGKIRIRKIVLFSFI